MEVTYFSNHNAPDLELAAPEPGYESGHLTLFAGLRESRGRVGLPHRRNRAFGLVNLVTRRIRLT